MTAYKNKVLLLPTTDFTAKCFYETYRLVLDQFEFTMILEGKNIGVTQGFSGFSTQRMRSYALKKKFIMCKFVFPFLLRLEVRSILRRNDFKSIIVSNECGLHQSIFIKMAQGFGIKCISHQVSSGIVNKDVLERKVGIAKRMKLLLYGARRCKGYGYYSDEVWLMGEAWSSILSRTDYEIMPNGYYVNLFSSLNESLSINRHLEKGNFNVVFYGGPLSEIELTTSNQHLQILESFELFAISNKHLENTKFLYKPHPQEKLVWENADKFRVVDIVECSPDEALHNTDIGFSVSSSMSLQARLIGKRSIGIHPDWLSEEITMGSKYFFDIILNDITKYKVEDLLKFRIEHGDEVNEVVNMDIDLKSKLLLRL